MKKVFATLLLSVLFFACKKDKDEVLIPAAPFGLIATFVEPSQVNLSWVDNSSNETGFVVERSEGTGSFADLATVGIDVTNYTDNSVNGGTTYTYRVSSISSTSKRPSNEVTVSTAFNVLPVLTTTDVTGIDFTTATSGGNITDDAGSAVTDRGVVWDTNENPTTALSTKTSDGTGTGVFTSTITGLTANTTYYVRAYATNANGTSYGQQVTFSTPDLIPVVTTTAVTAIALTTATSGGNITADGGSPVTERGVVWDVNQNPTTALSTKTSDGTGTGAFTSSITGLTANTTYYVRAYATNANGTSYGQQVTFTTLAPPCDESNVVLNDLLGDYANTNELLGTGPYGPYTTSISSATSTGPTSAEIVVENIWDNGWGPITFLLDWSDPANRTAIVVPQEAIPGSDAGDLNAMYAGQTIAVRVPEAAVSTVPGTFSACGQTFQLQMQLGVTGIGYFPVLYTVTLER